MGKKKQIKKLKKQLAKAQYANAAPSAAMDPAASAMLDDMMGEQSGLVKDLVRMLGVDDQEFWKGAMIGATAALLLSNDNVRNSLMTMVSSGGEKLKSGGVKAKETVFDSANSVKQTAQTTAANVKQTVHTGSEIFKETYQAGKSGFDASMERHNHIGKSKPEEPAPSSDIPAQEELADEQ
ncbi:YtxH domain-containing protein [Ferrimonas pelagia]|uniref:YtxH-like protein n=1 Tax=Ferrimonas pelagia TaxID=1177826 RepID=A0ABP9F4T3_9GAMM